MSLKISLIIYNEAKLNFDKKLTYDALSSISDVRSFEETGSDQVLERVGSSVVLVTKEMTLSAAVIEDLPASVRLICEAGTGYNNINVEAARKRGITVCNVPSYSTDAVAQLVITFILNLSCSLVPLQRKLAVGDAVGWRSLGSLPHFELAGKTLGLIGGRGTIGSRVADIALMLGMNILISSRSTAGDSKRQGVDIVDMETLLCQSDFVSIHCPLSSSTRHLIGARELKMMKPSAYLINTARGPIIDETALVEALEAGTIAGAGLDVQEVEPLPVDSPLIRMSNVILTPHVGWQRIESRQRLMDTVASNIKAFLDGSPVNVVN
ncbi:hypothetical protein CEUSTIGMA_g3053.t1 [Chlamydomonas eustigma]|uniref:S-adenosyl-L-homocysteine hydrolase NAD binding domain-containing protein n=1 Tax=Chlamydomonas eustigma TaxID=1157962 RepID=A0A250WY40_9CHLO|nr:hypothetical protein CEUSTIGMA_g3053.t1 [Chlamydomonas eustigma]|eukprot:GAX75609.1 hypothetical protein CEUSTIGMA_g3053.t1 [Chlamydomonas eustigma]